MDRLEHYRQSTRKFLDRYVDIWREKDIETQLVIDSERDHYLLLRVGWEGDKRINYPVGACHLCRILSSPHPPAPSPKKGEGEPNQFKVPLQTWERDLG